MENLQIGPGYIGEHNYNLDTKNRVAVPAAWRFEDDADPNAYFMAWPHPDGCIAVYPPEMWREFLEKTRTVKQSDSKGQKMLRDFFGKATKFACDKQGRILIPETLKKQTAIEKEVVFVGTGNNFQIWSAERYSAQEDEEFDLLNTMGELGL